MALDREFLAERIKKLDELKATGVNPYPHRYDHEITKKSIQIKAEHKGLAPETHTDALESVAGRVMLLRRMGKASFATIQDGEGQIQIYFRQDDIGESSYNLFRKIDIGDIIGVTGKIFTTKTGEITISAESFMLLTKSVSPLPEKFHGVKDTEIKYRKRHLDLIMNPESKKVFENRLRILAAIREFMNARGFVEVETPVLNTLYGGASARPFITHHNELDIDLYLRISPELFLKRLLVGGFERVYDINKNFRNEGIDTTHNPEFTMMECYQAYADYTDMMDLMESLYDYCARKVLGTTKVQFRGHTVDVAKPWRRVTMLDAIKEYAHIDVTHMTVEDLLHIVEKEKIEFKKEKNWGMLVAAIFEHFCEDKFVNPTFVIDHPRETTPLCKGLRIGDSRLIERFEPFCMGMELGNAYSELNDPVLQRKLLEDQQRQLANGDDEANPLDEDFLTAIETGMPPAGGLGVGIDRMVMVLLGQESIRDIIFFPTMKPEVVDETAEVSEEKKE